MLRTAALLSLSLLALPALAGPPSGNAAAGAEKAKVCASCHGATGNESLDATYPKLAGQHADYLAKALRDYRSGDRANVVMAAIAQPLTDADIDDLAAFFASQSGDLHDLSDVGDR